MVRAEVVSDLVGDGVDCLLVIVRVDLTPGKVTVSLTQSIEVPQPFHTADVSVQEEVDQAVVSCPANPGYGTQ